MHKLLLLLGIVPLIAAQNVTEAPPPPPVLLTTAKSGVIPAIPTGTPFGGVDTEQGAIIMPRPPLPGYTGLLGSATQQLNQPAATYVARLTQSMFNPLVGTVIQGTLQAIGGPNGVTFTVNITDLPSQALYGPFAWHIHNIAVPSNGNCTATLGHLDPTNRGELYMCDAARPETCQVGDLAGKYGGKIATNNTFTKTFTDPYLSVVPGTPGFFGGLGFVLHTSNTSRMTCANFQLVGQSSNSSTNGTATGGGVARTGTMTMPPLYTGNSAATVGVGGLAMGVLAAVVML